MATTPATIRESLAKSGRLARLSSPGLHRAEQGVDFQVELDDLASDNRREAEALRREIAEDAADDRRRFLKYQAVEHAIRHGDKTLQLAAFHSLVAHIENDELREDERRLGKRQARVLHAARLASLRGIFRDEIMPLLAGEA